jgi:Excreted virulence factor EspC, type VII ESX diderm
MLAGSRPKRMFADTDAVRALGSANSTHATDLADIAATLSSLPDAASMLGPVGAQFLIALAEAAADGSRAVASLSDRLATSNRTAYASAAAYDDADSGAGARISGV